MNSSLCDMYFNWFCLILSLPIIHNFWSIYIRLWISAAYASYWPEHCAICHWLCNLNVSKKISTIQNTTGCCSLDRSWIITNGAQIICGLSYRVSLRKVVHDFFVHWFCSCITMNLLSIELVDWPKQPDMFKARDATARQHQLPVFVCAFYLLFTNIYPRCCCSHRTQMDDCNKRCLVAMLIHSNCDEKLELTQRQDMFHCTSCISVNWFMVWTHRSFDMDFIRTKSTS